MSVVSLVWTTCCCPRGWPKTNCSMRRTSPSQLSPQPGQEKSPGIRPCCMSDRTGARAAAEIKLSHKLYIVWSVRLPLSKSHPKPHSTANTQCSPTLDGCRVPSSLALRDRILAARSGSARCCPAPAAARMSDESPPSLEGFPQTLD